MDWADILIMFTIYSSQIFNNFYIRDPFDLNIHVKNQKRSCFFLFLMYLLFLAVLGLCCCTWAFSSCSDQGLLFVAVRGLLIAMASLVAEHGL